MRCFSRENPLADYPASTLKTKKDALWKPLLRRFRKYIQDQVSSQRMHAKIFDQTIQEWAIAYAEALNLP